MVKKEQNRKKVKEYNDLRDFTGKPEINEKSKDIQRGVNDLMEWKAKTEKKKEDFINKRAVQEQTEIISMQTTHTLNKKSQKYVQQKMRQAGKFEDRMMRDA